MSGTTHVTISMKDLAPFFRNLGPKFEKAAIQGLRDSGQMLKRGILEQIQETKVDGKHRPPVDTGVYRAAWRVTSLPDGCRVSNDTAYAAIVELGRGPGPISEEGFRHLCDWVRRKRLYLDALPAAMAAVAGNHAEGTWAAMEHARLLDVMAGKRKGGRNPYKLGSRGAANYRDAKSAAKKAFLKDATEVAVEHVAWAVRKKIEEQGTEPRYPFARGLVAAEQDMRDVMHARLEEVTP
jgi:hypothetical protein